MKVSDLEFHECESCAKRSGTPPLCKGCLHNREVISKANRRINRLLHWFDLISNMLELEREDVIR